MTSGIISQNNPSSSSLKYTFGLVLRIYINFHLLDIESAVFDLISFTVNCSTNPSFALARIQTVEPTEYLGSSITSTLVVEPHNEAAIICALSTCRSKLETAILKAPQYETNSS